MTDQLKQLSEAATQGDWWPDGDDREGMEWNFHIMHGESDRVCFMSNMGSNRTAESGANATFICALVNAYRAGELIPASEARAQVAVAYEVAAGRCKIAGVDEFAPLTRSRDEAFSACAGHLEREIRALTSDHTTTALEQIKQQARDEGKREAAEAAGVLLPENGAGQACNDTDRLIDTVRRECVNAILATLSADTQENSDG